MREIQLKDAKATLSAVVGQAVAGEPAVIPLTANERHFLPLGVPLVNPLKQLP